MCILIKIYYPMEIAVVTFNYFKLSRYKFTLLFENFDMMRFQISGGSSLFIDTFANLDFASHTFLQSFLRET